MPKFENFVDSFLTDLPKALIGQSIYSLQENACNQGSWFASPCTRYSTCHVAPGCLIVPLDDGLPI